MKRLGWLVICLAIAGPGCLGLGGLRDDPRKKPVEVAPPPPPPSPVVVDDVNEKNTADIVRKLTAELERDEGERQPTPPAEPVKR